MEYYLSKGYLINKVFKALYIYEENEFNYPKYLRRLIVEMRGYLDEDKFNEKEKKVIFDSLIALKGLLKSYEVKETDHDTIRKIILFHVNKLQQELR